MYTFLVMQIVDVYVVMVATEIREANPNTCRVTTLPGRAPCWPNLQEKHELKKMLLKILKNEHKWNILKTNNYITPKDSTVSQS